MKSLQGLRVGGFYHFGKDSMIKILDLNAPGWGEVVSPLGSSSSDAKIPLLPCLDAIGEEIVPQNTATVNLRTPSAIANGPDNEC